MTEIEKTYSGKPLRIYIEDGEVLLSVRDLCWLLGDRNPNRKLQRAGIDNARYRSLDTNGGVQRMRLVSPRECETLLGSLRATARLLALCSWLKGVFDELAAASTTPSSSGRSRRSTASSSGATPRNVIPLNCQSRQLPNWRKSIPCPQGASNWL